MNEQAPSKEQLIQFVQELADEAAGNGNSEEWIAPRRAALLSAILRLDNETPAA